MSACGDNTKNNNKYDNLINAIVYTQEKCLNDDNYSNDYITINGKRRQAANSNRAYDGKFSVALKMVVVTNNAIYLAETYYQSDDVLYFLFCEIDNVISEGNIIWENN